MRELLYSLGLGWLYEVTLALYTLSTHTACAHTHVHVHAQG